MPVSDPEQNAHAFTRFWCTTAGWLIAYHATDWKHPSSSCSFHLLSRPVVDDVVSVVLFAGFTGILPSSTQTESIRTSSTTMNGDTIVVLECFMVFALSSGIGCCASFYED